LLHEGGYSVCKYFQGNWSFRTSGGRLIPDSPLFKKKYYEKPSCDGFGNGGPSVSESIAIYAAG